MTAVSASESKTNAMRISSVDDPLGQKRCHLLIKRWHLFWIVACLAIDASCIVDRNGRCLRILREHNGNLGRSWHELRQEVGRPRRKHHTRAGAAEWHSAHY